MALVNPMAGDRWQKEGGVMTLHYYSRDKVDYGWSGPGHAMPPMNNYWDPWLPAFARWAENAEYLGGSETNNTERPYSVE